MSRHFMEPFTQDKCNSLCDYCLNSVTETISEVDYTNHAKVILKVLNEIQHKNKVLFKIFNDV